MAKTNRSVKNFRNPPKRSKNKRGRAFDAKAVEIAERRYHAVNLRREGYSINEIAVMLGCGPETVRNDIVNVLNLTITTTAETAEEARQLMDERFDGMLKAVYPFATRSHKEKYIHPVTQQEMILELPPDPKYVQVALNIEAQRAKLKALNMPETKKVEVGIRRYEGVNMDAV